jgi:hypothetical protein
MELADVNTFRVTPRPSITPTDLGGGFISGSRDSCDTFNVFFPMDASPTVTEVDSQSIDRDADEERITQLTVCAQRCYCITSSKPLHVFFFQVLLMHVSIMVSADVFSLQLLQAIADKERLGTAESQSR